MTARIQNTVSVMTASRPFAYNPMIPLEGTEFCPFCVEGWQQRFQMMRMPEYASDNCDIAFNGRITEGIVAFWPGEEGYVFVAGELCPDCDWRMLKAEWGKVEVVCRESV